MSAFIVVYLLIHKFEGRHTGTLVKKMFGACFGYVASHKGTLM